MGQRGLEQRGITEAIPEPPGGPFTRVAQGATGRHCGIVTVLSNLTSRYTFATNGSSASYDAVTSKPSLVLAMSISFQPMRLMSSTSQRRSSELRISCEFVSIGGVLVAHLLERARDLGVLEVHGHQPDAGVERRAQDQQDDDDAEKCRAALALLHRMFSLCSSGSRSPMRLQSGACGRFQLSQIRTALPTTLSAGTNPTSGKRLSRLLSRLSPMKK